MPFTPHPFPTILPSGMISRRWRALGGACWLGLAAILGAAEPAKIPFDVPADAAEKAIRVFSQQAGLEVLFPTEITRGLRTQSIKGMMPARQALEAMLRGTGLVA